ncbi:unnamed protein product, partial [Didymodactylos carnosus]
YQIHADPETQELSLLDIMNVLNVDMDNETPANLKISYDKLLIVIIIRVDNGPKQVFIHHHSNFEEIGCSSNSQPIDEQKRTFALAYLNTFMTMLHDSIVPADEIDYLMLSVSILDFDHDFGHPIYYSKSNRILGHKTDGSLYRVVVPDIPDTGNSYSMTERNELVPLSQVTIIDAYLAGGAFDDEGIIQFYSGLNSLVQNLPSNESPIVFLLLQKVSVIPPFASVMDDEEEAVEKEDVDEVLDMSLIVTIGQTTEKVKIYCFYSFGTQDLWILTLIIESDKKQFSSIMNYEKLLELIETDHPTEAIGYMMFKSLEKMSKELI